MFRGDSGDERIKCRGVINKIEIIIEKGNDDRIITATTATTATTNN